MPDKLEALRSSVIAAVQEELTRFSGQVSTAMRQLNDELAKERAARDATEEKLNALVPALETRLNELCATSKRRHDETGARIDRVADEANVGIAAAVEAAARPLFKKLEDRQHGFERELAALDGTIRKFDERAADVVAHLNAVSQVTETRLDEVSTQIGDEIEGRLAALSTRLDDVSAESARQRSEVANVVGRQVDLAEERVNERLLSAEARVSEHVGQRIADIDAYVGRVSAGLDESVSMINDRISACDSQIAEVTTAVDAVHQKLGELDADGIDELRDRVTSAAGEVELVRIETERFQETMGETMDKLTARLVDVETIVQEQHMDVETAVQLERLEEVERAIIALDPSQFVRRDETESVSVASPASPLSAPEPFHPTGDSEY